MKMSHYLYVMTLGFGLVANVSTIAAMRDKEEEASTSAAMASEKQRLEMELFDAVSTSNLPKVQMLITQGVNVNACDSDGKTPLMIAVKGKFRRIAEALIEAGAACYVCERCGKNMELCCHHNEKPNDLFFNECGRPICIICGACATILVQWIAWVSFWTIVMGGKNHCSIQ